MEGEIMEIVWNEEMDVIEMNENVLLHNITVVGEHKFYT